jgi:hypothetical protein
LEPLDLPLSELSLESPQELAMEPLPRFRQDAGRLLVAEPWSESEHYAQDLFLVARPADRQVARTAVRLVHSSAMLRVSIHPEVAPDFPPMPIAVRQTVPVAAEERCGQPLFD